MILTRANHGTENFDDDDYDSGDEYTTGLVHKDSDYAEKHGHDTGRPGSFLSRLIAHGNKKTEEQLAKEDEERMKRESGLMARQEAHQRGETASAGRVQN